MAEYIEREAFLKDIEERYCLPCKDAGRDHNGCKCRACWVDDMRGDVIDAPTADVEKMSDGYHTFADLYEQRLILSAAIDKKIRMHGKASGRRIATFLSALDGP